MGSTVFALATPLGGAIAMIRISGENARALLERLFTGRIEHRRVSYGRITDGAGETVDTCTAVFYAAPDSYTGEDCAEISFHGSYAVAVRLAELIEGTGLASPAEPGEFTKRAYLNGKMDLAQAEAVMDIVSSTAEKQRRAAARQLEGRLSAAVASLYKRLSAVSALIAAAMDDDTGETEADEEGVLAELSTLSAELDSLSAGGMRARVLREGARIAIIGSPNVGKSSLLNALIMRERAIVTPIPGTTRDTVEEAASVEGIPVVFVDTAGIRETADEVERMGIERSLRECGEAELVLWLIEGARGLSNEDEEIRRGLDPQKTIAVITKNDLEQVVGPDTEGRLCGFPAVTVSSLTGEGLGELKLAIAKKLVPAEAEALVTNRRHIAALSCAAHSVSEAEALLRCGMTDAAFFELRTAMDQLAAITGREDPAEDLVNEIFANFCVGK